MANVQCKKQFRRVSTLIREYRLGCCFKNIMDLNVYVNGKHWLFQNFLNHVSTKFVLLSLDDNALFLDDTCFDTDLIAEFNWVLQGFNAFIDSIDIHNKYSVNSGCHGKCHERMIECRKAVEFIIWCINTSDILDDTDPVYDIELDLLFYGLTHDIHSTTQSNVIENDISDLDSDIVSVLLETPDITPPTTIKRKRKATQLPKKKRRKTLVFCDQVKVKYLLSKWNWSGFKTHLQNLKRKNGKYYSKSSIHAYNTSIVKWVNMELCADIDLDNFQWRVLKRTTIDTEIKERVSKWDNKYRVLCALKLFALYVNGN